MKIDKNRNISVDSSKDEVMDMGTNLSITNENGVRFILPYDKIDNKKEFSSKKRG